MSIFRWARGFGLGAHATTEQTPEAQIKQIADRERVAIRRIASWRKISLVLFRSAKEVLVALVVFLLALAGAMAHVPDVFRHR